MVKSSLTQGLNVGILLWDILAAVTSSLSNEYVIPHFYNVKEFLLFLPYVSSQLETFSFFHLLFVKFQTTSKSDVRSYARSDTFRTGSALVSSPSRRWSVRDTVSPSGTCPGTPSSSRSGVATRSWSGGVWRTLSVESGLTYSVKTAKRVRIGSK